MIDSFHWLRPYWLVALIPLFLFAFYQKKKTPWSNWNAICDPELLNFLIITNLKKNYASYALLTALLFMIISLAGPSWIKLPVPSYQENNPRILVLDLSTDMDDNDIQPSRLARAKFKLHDIFHAKNAEEFALIAFTEQAFVVSPITEDANTIDSLIDSLTPDIMPVQGSNLSEALLSAANLIKQAGFPGGSLLVLTANPPDNHALKNVKILCNENISTSILPITANPLLPGLYQKIAKAGHGQVLSFSDDDKDIKQWLKATVVHKNFKLNEQNASLMWRDEGRWFLIPALLLLIPAFRRNWLARITA